MFKHDDRTLFYYRTATRPPMEDAICDAVKTPIPRCGINASYFGPSADAPRQSLRDALLRRHQENLV